MNELSQSIAEYGILNPLTVRLRDNRYELVAGERRLRAAKLAGLVEVPCILLDVGLEDASLIALIENLQRRDLDFIEEASSALRWSLLWAPCSTSSFSAPSSPTAAAAVS